VPKAPPAVKAARLRKVAAIIPARWGSTRFPGKPLHFIAGKPLIQHVWERCSRARMVDEVVIATDDKRIAEAAADFGAKVSMTSPKHRSGTDRVAEVARKLRGVSHVINVQGDEPLIDPKLVDRLAQTLRASPDVEMITAANSFAPDEDVTNPNAVKVVLDAENNALYFSRGPIPFARDGKSLVPSYRHQGIYGYSAKLLDQFVRWKPTRLEQTEQLEQLRALEHGVKIRVVITKHASVGVDTPEDLQTVNDLLNKR
jgi:3-deoxy-manno-octulosonate cytidylyltransferase (CMP-KDO synthetase)